MKSMGAGLAIFTFFVMSSKHTRVHWMEEVELRGSETILAVGVPFAPLYFQAS